LLRSARNDKFGGKPSPCFRFEPLPFLSLQGSLRFEFERRSLCCRQEVPSFLSLGGFPFRVIASSLVSLGSTAFDVIARFPSYRLREPVPISLFRGSLLSLGRVPFDAIWRVPPPCLSEAFFPSSL